MGEGRGFQSCPAGWVWSAGWGCPADPPHPPRFATGEPRLPVPGLHLPPAQPQDASALPAGNPARCRGPPLVASPQLLRVPALCCLPSPCQNKNGEGIPSAVGPRAQRPPTAAPAAPTCSSSKQPAPDTEASEQRALRTVQYGLLRILSRTLAALRRFTPDVCQVLLDQVLRPAPQPPWGHRGSALHPEVPGGLDLHQSCLVLQSLDLAEYSFLFALSFTTPTFDSEGAPSFGTLLATVNVALNMLGEVSWVLSGPSP